MRSVTLRVVAAVANGVIAILPVDEGHPGPHGRARQ